MGYKAQTIKDFEQTNEKYQVEILGEIQPMVSYEVIKRLADIVCAGIGLVVFAIPMLIIALLIKRDSPGKVIYAQERLGKDEVPFMIYKFRTMKEDAEAEGIQWAASEDPRVTPVGKTLRRTRLDELPQFINILKGEMTLVGPRPERPEFYDVFDTYIIGFRQRMLVKPGMTGYAQVVGGYYLQPQEKIVFDIEYIKKRSWRMDIRLICQTVKVVFKGDKSREELGKIQSYANIVKPEKYIKDIVG